MTKRTRLAVGLAVASVVIVLIVQYFRWYSYRQLTLSSDGPRYIKSLSLSESKARLDSIGDKPAILSPPKNWDKVAAVVRELCLDVGCEDAAQTRSRHRGPPLDFSIFGYTTVNGNNYPFCEFRFDFYDLGDSSIKLTVDVNWFTGLENHSTLQKHSDESLTKELARRIGISVDVPELD